MTTRKLAATFLILALVAVFPAPTAEALPSRGDVQKQLDSLGREIAILDEEYNLSRIQMTKVEQQIRDLRSRGEKAEAELQGLRNQVSARAASAYRRGVPDVLILILESKSISEFGRKMSLASRVGAQQAGVVESLEISKVRAAHLDEDLQAELQKRQKITASLSSRKSQLEKRMAEQKVLLARLDAAAAPAKVRVAASKPAVVPAPANVPLSGRAGIAVETAYAQLGKPYRWGASGPDSFDCSGLTMYSWRRAGVSLPHSSRAQYSATKRVAREDLQPGDLVFFGSPIHHVGIYAGDGKMIHSPETGKNVRIWTISRRDYAGAGRPGV
ncbi:MAG: C40 family peptidase [Actinobacteria bacterium]|nr:C40 family peptidase [Actinomycetota bacterium]